MKQYPICLCDQRLLQTHLIKNSGVLKNKGKEDKSSQAAQLTKNLQDNLFQIGDPKAALQSCPVMKTERHRKHVFFHI